MIQSIDLSNLPDAEKEIAEKLLENVQQNADFSRIQLLEELHKLEESE